jgi:hypothetical protein
MVSQAILRKEVPKGIKNIAPKDISGKYEIKHITKHY